MSGERGLLLAIDFGLKRIGIASANTLTGTATPLTTLKVAGDLPWPAIDRLIAEWQPVQLVVGLPDVDPKLPIHMGALQFIAELSRRSDLPVATVDEAYTSASAAESLRAGRRDGTRPRRLRKDDIDSHAACLIAEQWMNTEHNEH
jgi:putative Holliday junction resolvase